MNQHNEPFRSTPKRPYLLRAFYEWIVDNGMTPYILVDARSEQVRVPRAYVKDGNIVLNISMTATQHLAMNNDEISFQARFGGKAFAIWLPIWAVQAIYSRETQESISFPPDEYADLQPELEQASKRPKLAAVPSSGLPDDATPDTLEEKAATEQAAGEPAAVPQPPKQGSAKTDGKPRPSFLKVVK